MMQDELVTRKVAELARERGFNEKVDRFYPLNDDKGEAVEHCDGPACFNKYTYTIAAPTQSLLQRWLRVVHYLHIEIVATASGYIWLLDKTNGTSVADSDYQGTGANENSGCYDTYELALEDGLRYALENLKRIKDNG